MTGEAAETRSSRAPSSRALRAFLDDEVDDRRLADLIRGYALVSPREAAELPTPGRRGAPLPAPFAACLLAQSRLLPTSEGLLSLNRTPGIVPALVAGKVQLASQLAARRLSAMGVPLAFDRAPGTRQEARRMAAALAFPVDLWLAQRALAAVSLQHDDDNSSSPTPGDIDPDSNLVQETL